MPLSTKLPAKRKKFDQTERNAYRKLITNVAIAFIESKGSSINRNDLERDVREMIDFEVKLSEVSFFFFFFTF